MGNHNYPRPAKYKPRVIVAGYGSWAQTAINPSTEVLAELRKQNREHCTLYCLDIPVDTVGLFERLEACIQKYQPDVWIGVGVAVGSPAIRLETIGINIRSFNVPDINGITLEPTPVLHGGPVAYQASLKFDDITHHLNESGIPAIMSFHAGTHLCNQMLYSILHISAMKKLNLLSGFIHVPQSTANSARDNEAICSSMSIPMMTSALEITIENAVNQFYGVPYQQTTDSGFS